MPRMISRILRTSAIIIEIPELKLQFMIVAVGTLPDATPYLCIFRPNQSSLFRLALFTFYPKNTLARGFVSTKSAFAPDRFRLLRREFKAMNVWPEFNERGDLPIGIHKAPLNEIVDYFATTPRRVVLARRLERIYRLSRSTGHLAHFIIFGSFVTAEPEPNDVDIFLLMEDSFDVR